MKRQRAIDVVGARFEIDLQCGCLSWFRIWRQFLIDALAFDLERVFFSAGVFDHESSFTGFRRGRHGEVVLGHRDIHFMRCRVAYSVRDFFWRFSDSLGCGFGSLGSVLRHTFHLGERLNLDDYTIPISDLLLTKLQVVETNEKDIRDLIAILKDHDVVERIDSGDREVIDTGYISTLCADDWGLCKTISLTLKKLLTFLPKYELQPEANQVLEARISKLLHAIETVPKSLKWKLRDKVGERKRWYDLPEVPIRTQSVSSA